MGFKKYIPLIGRAFLAAIFLKAAVANTLGFPGIVEMMTEQWFTFSTFITCR